MSAEPLEARTLERFCKLCERAQAYGLHVCLEFAIYTGVKTLGDASRLVKTSGCSNASVLVDALHFSRSGGLPSDIAGIDAAIPLAVEAPVLATTGLPALERAQRAYRSMQALLE